MSEPIKGRIGNLCFAASLSALLSIGGTALSRADQAGGAVRNLAGVYTPTGGLGPEPRNDLGNLKPLNPLHGAVATAHLQPWARAKMQANAEAGGIDDRGSICSLVGLFRHPTTVAGYMVMQTPNVVYLVSTDLVQVGVRRVFMTDHHPRNLAPTWDGHSIGHWDGDTLVVDTVGFNDKSWLGSELQPHSEELHLVERIRVVRDAGNEFLEIYSTVDDREALTGPYSFSRYYKRTNQRFEQVASSCNPEPGDQEMWNYMRNQAIQQFEKNRSAGAK